jgi:hypothetical protein
MSLTRKVPFMFRRVLTGCSALLLAAACGTNDASTGQGNSAAQSNPLCQATTAKQAFGATAICVCDDLALTGAGFVAHSTSGQTADVGVNGVDRIIGYHKVSGAMTAMGGFTGVGDIEVGTNLSTASDMLGLGRVTTGGNLMVGGRLADVGVLQVSGTLGVGGEAQLIGGQDIGNRGAYVAPSEPCGCGAPAVDVAAKIADAMTSATNLGKELDVGATELELHTGSYYLESITTIGATKLTVDGAVALFVAGDFRQVGAELIALTPGSTLDVYIGGAFETVGAEGFGRHADPGAVRIFLAQSHDVSFAVGAQLFNASIYAPQANLALVGDTKVHGAIFAKSLNGVGLLDIDYVSPQAADPNVCAPPGSNGTAPGSGSPTIN